MRLYAPPDSKPEPTITRHASPRWVHRVAGWTIATTLVAGGCSKPAPETAFGSGLPQVDASPAVRDQEHAMHRLINRDRAAQGLPPLTYDERLADVARFHSADMRDHRFFEHDSPNSGSLQDRLHAAGYLFLEARENLSEAPDVQLGQEGLLASPPHHANIMAADVTHVGVGIVPGGVHVADNMTITQVFARPGRAESAAEARSSLLEAIQSARADAGKRPAKLSPLLDELARAHVATLAEDEGQLERIADRITEEVSRRREKNQRGVVVGAQRITDSSTLQIPSPLLTEPEASFGLAVHPAKAPGGRPVLQVLLLIGI